MANTQVFFTSRYLAANTKKTLLELEAAFQREMRELDYKHQRKMMNLDLFGGVVMLIAAAMQLPSWYANISNGKWAFAGASAAFFAVLSWAAFRYLRNFVRQRRDLRVKMVVDRMGV
jgi:hypothetical protein